MLKIPWEIKPPLGVENNKSHYRHKNLCAFWKFNAFGGKKLFNPLATSNGTPLWVGDHCKPNAGYFSSDNGKFQLTDAGITIITNVRYGGSNQPGIIAQKSSAEWDADTGYSLSIRSNTGLYFKVGQSNTLRDSATLTAGKFENVAARWKPGVQEVYLNGEEITYTQHQEAATTPVNSTDNFKIGTYFNNSASTTMSGNDAFKYLIIFNSFLSVEEIREIHRNPWYLVEPRKLFFGTDSGGDNVTGTISATIPLQEVSIAGFQGIDGNIDSTIPLQEVAISGLIKNVGSINSVIPIQEVSIDGGQTNEGSIESVIPIQIIDIQGNQGISGTLDINILIQEVSIVGEQINSGTINATIPLQEVSIAGAQTNSGEINVIIPLQQVNIEGVVRQDIDGTINAVIPIQQINIQGSIPVKKKGGGAFKNGAFKNSVFDKDIFKHPPSK